MVATVVAFLDAYNGGHVEAVLALMTEDASVSDCDYRTASGVSARRTEEIRQWLRDRAADHDQLVLESIANENPTGSHIVAVSYAKRTSDDRIRTFANGPGGGASDLCRPIP